jgi:hypothetical protein
VKDQFKNIEMTDSKVELKSASYFFDINQKSVVEIIDDSNPEKGLTLRASEDIPEHVPVILYYGTPETPEQNIVTYFEDSEKYIRDMAPYIRALTSDRSINARHLIPDDKSKNKLNMNLLGVLVNDVSKPKSLKAIDLIDYLKTQEECNLVSSVQTDDYPLYISNRCIKKGEILTVHYGLGYWLLQMGIPPSGISHIIQSIMSHINQEPIQMSGDD